MTPAKAEQIQRIAIACQYGIKGFATGIDEYVLEAVVQIDRWRPDLLILSGGGRNGRTTLRESDSVAHLYRRHLPDIPVLLERHSRTTWKNLVFSFEMLCALGCAPRTVAVFCDGCRRDKVRVASRLARRRFPEMKKTRLEILPIERQAATWRDSRLAQFAFGGFQLAHEIVLADRTA